MPKKIKSIFSKIEDAFDFVFKSPASNQLRISKTNPRKFGSYIQLKRYQKHFRKVVFEIFLALVFLFVGILFGPAVFKDQFKSEIYIPDGKGDIIIGNISKNQATVIFKTLDQINDNKPLATAAVVEIYLDPDFTILYKKTNVFEYAVTHIIPLNGLKEGRDYYLKILASEYQNMSDAKEVVRWGGKEPISFFTSGEEIQTCAELKRSDNVLEKSQNIVVKNDNVQESVKLAQSMRIDHEKDLGIFQINSVDSENYLHGRKKVQTIVSWETNFPATSSLIYRGENDANETEISGGPGFSKKHQITTLSLNPESTYYFKVKSRNENGEVAVSEEYSMRTPKPDETAFEMMLDNLDSLAKQIGF